MSSSIPQPTQRSMVAMGHFADIRNVALNSMMCDECGKLTTELTDGCDSDEKFPKPACKICLACALGGTHMKNARGQPETYVSSKGDRSTCRYKCQTCGKRAARMAAAAIIAKKKIPRHLLPTNRPARHNFSTCSITKEMAKIYDSATSAKDEYVQEKAQDEKAGIVLKEQLRRMRVELTKHMGEAAAQAVAAKAAEEAKAAAEAAEAQPAAAEAQPAAAEAQTAAEEAQPAAAEAQTAAEEAQPAAEAAAEAAEEEDDAELVDALASGMMTAEQLREDEDLELSDAIGLAKEKTTVCWHRYEVEYKQFCAAAARTTKEKIAWVRDKVARHFPAATLEADDEVDDATANAREAEADAQADAENEAEHEADADAAIANAELLVQQELAAQAAAQAAAEEQPAEEQPAEEQPAEEQPADSDPDDDVPLSQRRGAALAAAPAAAPAVASAAATLAFNAVFGSPDPPGQPAADRRSGRSRADRPAPPSEPGSDDDEQPQQPQQPRVRVPPKYKAKYRKYVADNGGNDGWLEHLQELESADMLKRQNAAEERRKALRDYKPLVSRYNELEAKYSELDSEFQRLEEKNAKYKDKLAGSKRKIEATEAMLDTFDFRNDLLGRALLAFGASRSLVNRLLDASADVPCAGFPDGWDSESPFPEINKETGEIAGYEAGGEEEGEEEGEYNDYSAPDPNVE